MKGQLFKNMKLNGKPLAECELALECNSRNYRLYVEREESGFHAMAVEFISGGGMDEDFWLSPNLEVDQLFQVIARFDGVRHLEFNRESDMPGYIYYPNMEGIILMMQKVREIEKQCCKEYDEDEPTTDRPTNKGE
jgi:hypothetical protein